MKSFYFLSKLFFLSSFIGLFGCSNVSLDNKEQTPNVKKAVNPVEYLNTHTASNYIYSKRPVQFILKEGNIEKMAINLTIENSTKFEYINKRNQSNIKTNFINSSISQNNYGKKDFISISLEIKNHWGNEYLVANITRDYTSSTGKSNLHHVSNSYILGKRGELVPQTLNVPTISIN